MVAFIDDDLAVFGNKVLDLVFPLQTLNDRDIETTGSVHLSATDMSYRRCWQIQKHRESFPPLIEQLLPVDQYQSVDFTFCDEPCGYDRLSKRSRSRENAFIVEADLRNGFLLNRPKLALKPYVNWCASEPLVPNYRL